MDQARELAVRAAIVARRTLVGTVIGALSARLSGRSVRIAVGFSPWKEGFTRKLFLGDRLIFVDGRGRFRVVRALLGESAKNVAVWSLKDEAAGFRPSDFAGCDLLRLEDGFVRSLGRGIDHVPPWSLCLDRSGLYFDGGRPSDLENICNDLPEEEPAEDAAAVDRAIDRLKRAAISKYNSKIAPDPRSRPSHVPGSVLVLGQVEDDQSIRRNTNAISTNRGLLERALADRPGRRILFKQHPDCLGSPCRAGRVDVASLPGVEEVDPAVAITDAIEAVDTVYTISSLGGFEALLRDKEVVTFGAPFYAGWGLTRDHVEFPRRRRRLTVRQLFHAAFIRYPVYFDPHDGRRMTLLDVLDRFSRDMSGAD